MVLRLVIGDDAVLLSEALTGLIDGLVGDGDRSLMLEQLTEAEMRTQDGGWDVSRLLDAARTPPFLTERRVVVGRHLMRFSRKEDYTPLVELVSDDLATTDLILVWERGLDPKMDNRLPALPKALKDAVEVAGGTLISAKPATGKAASGWLHDQLALSTLTFAPAAVAAVEDLLGEERSRVLGLIRTLEGALGETAEVTAADIATFGGDAGSVVPWELDDAIDKGDINGALDILHRQLPTRHPFQLMAGLHGRYQRMLRLDGAGVNDEKAAAALLGMKGSTFPARKLLTQTRKLGSEKVAKAIGLLAEADLQLRGTVDWPDELVLEILVARLAALSPSLARHR
jgi:DNA polymerase-3 subunit delta